MLRLKRVPGIRVCRIVCRHTKYCTWCNYPIEPFQLEYALAVDGVRLGPTFCSIRCCTIEGREQRRGTLIIGGESVN